MLLKPCAIITVRNSIYILVLLYLYYYLIKVINQNLKLCFHSKFIIHASNECVYDCFQPVLP